MARLVVRNEWISEKERRGIEGKYLFAVIGSEGVIPEYLAALQALERLRQLSVSPSSRSAMRCGMTYFRLRRSTGRALLVVVVVLSAGSGGSRRGTGGEDLLGSGFVVVPVFDQKVQRGLETAMLRAEEGVLRLGGGEAHRE